MNKVLLVIAYNRPHYLEQVLEGINRQNFEDWRFICRLDGPKNDEDALTVGQCKALIAEKCPTMEIWERPGHFGMNRNAFLAIQEGFCRAEADHLIVLEDDCVPLKGFKEYMAWALAEVDAGNAQSATAYSHPLTRDLPENGVQTVEWFTPWAWATTRRRWEVVLPWAILLRDKGFDAMYAQFLQAHPFPKESRHFLDLGGEWTVRKSWARFHNQVYEILGLREIFPLIPRAINIGLVGTNQRKPLQQTEEKVVTSNDLPVYAKFDYHSTPDSVVETNMNGGS